MAAELKNDDAKHEEKEENKNKGRYSLTISIIKEKLELHLHDTSTKYMYHGSFDSHALQSCGFHVKQAQNLENVCKFMESARKGHQHLEFDISIEKNQNNQIEHGDFGVITIMKQDDFFPLEIVMKLKQTPRKKIDILEEHIKDLQTENMKFKEHINDLQTENIKLKQEISNHRMPGGSIIMWSGDGDTIPNGWKLCDGQNGTPDLRNRFIIGASDDVKMNSIGGNKTHSHSVTVNGHQLTVNEMPAHSHGVTHSMYIQHKYSDWRVGHRGQNLGEWNVSLAGGGNIKSTGGNQAHNHSASGSTETHLPPYYALCFIMKDV